MEFSRAEYWSGQPFPSPGDLPNPGIELRSPALQGVLYQLGHKGSPDLSGQPQTHFLLEDETVRGLTGTMIYDVHLINLLLRRPCPVAGWETGLQNVRKTDRQKEGCPQP